LEFKTELVCYVTIKSFCKVMKLTHYLMTYSSED